MGGASAARRRRRSRRAIDELAIGEFALLEGLSAAELEFMKPYLDRQLFPARAALYHEGQLGDRLYLLARGAVSIVAEDPEAKGKHRRVVTLAPGVIFGESAMIEGGTRSVTAIAEGEVVTYSLSRSNLEAIHARNPDLYRRIVAQHAGAHVGIAADDDRASCATRASRSSDARCGADRGGLRGCCALSGRVRAPELALEHRPEVLLRLLGDVLVELEQQVPLARLAVGRQEPVERAAFQPLVELLGAEARAAGSAARPRCRRRARDRARAGRRTRRSPRARGP